MSPPQSKETGSPTYEAGTIEDQFKRIKDYVVEHFKLIQCKRYVSAEKKTENASSFDPDDCVCGRPYEWHISKHIVPQSGDENCRKWSATFDTIRYPCDTYGKMLFAPGDGFDSTAIEPAASAFYIRLASSSRNGTTYMESIYKLMTAKTLWSLPTPQFIIEVTGTHRRLNYVDQGILDRLTTGVIKAANTAKAWIVTSGMNTGVDGLVGDAVSKSRMTSSEGGITCLGITSWSTVSNREQLIVSYSEPDLTVNGSNGWIRGNSISSQPSPSVYSTQQTTVFSIDVPDVEALTPNMNRDAMKYIQRQHGYTSSNFTPVYCIQRPERCEYGISLNPGHNCFLFVDNGIEKRFGEEIPFRAQFMHYLSQKTLRGAGTHGVSTPHVLLVVGGGIRALKTLELSLLSQTPDNNGTEFDSDASDDLPSMITIQKPDGETLTRSSKSPKTPKKTGSSHPVVIVQNFGGVSDLLAFAYEITAPPIKKDGKFSSQLRFEGKSHFPLDFDRRIKRHPAFTHILQLAPDHLREKEGAKIIQRIRNCLKHRHMLTIVDLSDEQYNVPLDQAILNAVLKSSFGSPTSTFELALLWDRVDVAKDLLIHHEKEISKQVDMKAALTRTLMNGQSEFFKLLVEYGLVDLFGYLTRYQIRCFYSDIFQKRKGKAGKGTCVSLFRNLLLNLATEETLSDVANPHLLNLLGQILSQLLGCYLDNVFTDEPSYKGYEALPRLALRADSVLPHITRDLCPYETSMRDLFILQLLLHRRDLAIYIWKRGHDHLGTALMASIFLKSLAKEANRLDMTDLGTAYKESSHEWRDRAISLLASCYEQDPMICSRLLTRSLLTWQTATILELAFYGNMKKFMEQPAVQTTLSQVWTGRLATFTRQGIVYLALIPPLLPFLIFRIRFEERTARNLPVLPGTNQQSASLSPGRRNAVSSMVSSPVIPPCLQTPSHSRFSTINPPASSSIHDIKLTRVTLFNSNKEGHISVWKAIYLLYTAPMAKYAVHTVSVLAFLFLFSCFLLSEEQTTVSWLECVIWICCLVFFLDIVRDGFGKTNLNVLERIEDFFSNTYVLAEIASLALVFVAAILKLTTTGYSNHQHTIYSAACVLYWLISLRLSFVHESIGPTVIGLIKMFADLMFFVLIYFILLLTFAVPIHTLLYPRHHITDAGEYFATLGDISYELTWGIFYISMDDMRLVAEGDCPADGFIEEPGSTTQIPMMLRDLPSSDNSTFFEDPTNGTISAHLLTTGDSANLTCSSRNLLARTLYIIFLLLTNIMLLNMLTAVFAHTVDKTRLSATRLWRFDMYRFLYEYYTRPVLPGPFMIFELVYRFFALIHRVIHPPPVPKNTDLKHFYHNLDDYEYRKMEMFELGAAECLLSENARERKAKSQDALAKKLRYINDRTIARFDRIEALLLKSLADNQQFNDSDTTAAGSLVDENEFPINSR